ncbi:YrhK family protein [Kocuria sp. TGY1127_2]|nr:YrhK family protein [Kocuria sp. TGY1127_2]
MRWTIGKLAHDFPWFHRWIGLIGNTLFVLGSIFFLSPGLMDAGTWIFIAASAGMMFDSIGEKLVRRENETRNAEPGTIRDTP